MGLQRPQLLPAGGLAVAPQARHVVRDEEVHGRVQPDAAARSSCPPLPARDHGGDGGDVCGDSRGRGTSPSSSIPGCPPRRVGGGQEQAGPPPLLHPPPPSGCTCARRLGALLRPQAAPHDRQTPAAAPPCSAFSPPGPGCALSPVTAFLSESHPELPEGLLLLLSLRPPPGRARWARLRPGPGASLPGFCPSRHRPAPRPTAVCAGALQVTPSASQPHPPPSPPQAPEPTSQTRGRVTSPRGPRAPSPVSWEPLPARDGSLCDMRLAGILRQERSPAKEHPVLPGLREPSAGHPDTGQAPAPPLPPQARSPSPQARTLPRG